MLAVFFDTIVICSCTAILILLFKETGSDAMGIQLTQQALAYQVGDWGTDFITIAILLFGFTSIVANYAYANNNLKYINLDNFYGRWFLRIGFLAMLIFGSMASLPEVIALADLSTGVMTLINVSVLLLFTKVLVTITNDYNSQHKQGTLPSYKPSDAEHEKFNLTKGIWRDNF